MQFQPNSGWLGVAGQIPRKLLLLARRVWARCLGREHLRVRLGSDVLLDVRLNDEIGVSIQKGKFEAFSRELILAEAKPGMVVLDIGANLGFYSVLLSRRVGAQGRVIAFEPNPTMVAQLRHNLALNGISNVRVEPVALSDRTGELEFFVPPAGLEGHGSLAPNITFTPAGRIRVQARTLDEVMGEAGITAVDLIKMDVEGAEYAVCRGAARLLCGPRQPVIFFECAEHLSAPFGYRAYQLLSLLESWGYTVRQIEYGQWLGRPASGGASGE